MHYEHMLEIIDLVLMHSYVLFFLAHVFLLSQLGPRCELGPLGSEGSSGLDKQNLHSSTANTNKAKLVTRALLPRVSVRAEGLTCCLDNSGRNAKCHLCSCFISAKESHGGRLAEAAVRVSLQANREEKRRSGTSSCYFLSCEATALCLFCLFLI